MKAVILAGGLGTRISEESHLRPKPMIEIGDNPILWHIMKCYSHYGFNDFIICCGYKSHMIKEYFADYYLHNSDITFDFSNGNSMVIHNNVAEPWRVTLVDTGLHTSTGGRIKRIQRYLENKPFMLTYGDGVSDVDIRSLVDFHYSHGKKITMTAVQPGGRYGVINIHDNGQVLSFREKAKEDGGWINAGYMVVDPDIIDKYISGDSTIFEREPLEMAAQNGEVVAYRYHGFWACMDTLRDKVALEEMWGSGKAPWKTW